MPYRTENLLFEGEKVDEMTWNFCGTVPAPRPIISTQFHAPGPPAPCTSMQEPSVLVDRLLASVMQEKESNKVAISHINKTNPHRHQDILIRTLPSTTWPARFAACDCLFPAAIVILQLQFLVPATIVLLCSASCGSELPDSLPLSVSNPSSGTDSDLTASFSSFECHCT